MPRFLPLCGIGLALGFAIGPGCILAQPFPKADPAQAFKGMKIYDAKGRPYRAAVEDWEGARQRVKDDPAWAKWLKDEEKMTDDWIAHHQDRVEWQAAGSMIL